MSRRDSNSLHTVKPHSKEKLFLFMARGEEQNRRKERKMNENKTNEKKYLVVAGSVELVVLGLVFGGL